ncbi:putative nicotianamine synthase [Helianthus annuus]|nr:putative nicotianamine synthase [Helianthus annuus]
MESFQEKITLLKKVCEIYKQLSKLETLKPCNHVDNLFTELVHTCIPHSSINIATLPESIHEIRIKLIRLCGEAEGHLEAHFSTILGSFKNPLLHLTMFPYYSNYLKLNRLEYNILIQHYSTTQAPKRVAFVGSGPLPLTSIVLASYYIKEATFHNYDIDSLANSMASHLVASDDDLSTRMVFHTADIMDVTNELQNYDVIFLAALVGIDVDEKVKVIQHLAKYMAPGAILMLRSAHGARAILYHVVDPQVLKGLDVLSIYHPDDDVINSIVISRKYGSPANTIARNTIQKSPFGNVKMVENPPLNAICDRFATDFLARRHLCHQSNLQPTFATDMTFQPILGTQRFVSIFHTEFVNPFYDWICDRPSLRPICGCVFCDRKCGRLFCHLQSSSDRFLVANGSRICFRILRKRLLPF